MIAVFNEEPILKTFRFKLLPFLLFLILFSSSSFSKDPFENFKYFKMENGMQVVLAPHENAKNVHIRLLVNTGHRTEEKESLQANHLLEHMLFRDGSLEGDKTYLQLIKEEGGKVNGYTGGSKVGYLTKISKDKLNWTLNLFKKMIFERKLDEKSLELAKASIELEIGEAGLTARTLGFDLWGSLSRFYFPKKDFFEKEFGIKPFPYTRDEESLNVSKLNLDVVNGFYRDYYYPSNMTLFVAGSFNPAELKAKLEKDFGVIPDRIGKTIQPEKAAFGGRSYEIFTPSNSNSTNITLGKKLFDATNLDSYVIDSYLEYVAHRLMIELRNKKGETYTAYASTYWNEGYGYSYVSFQTPIEKHRENLTYVEGLLEKEVKSANLSDEQIEKAVDLYLKQHYEIKDFDADSLMSLAGLFYATTHDFEEPISPYKLLKEIDTKNYKERLVNIFQKNGDYKVMSAPPLIFKYDIIFLLFLSLFVGVYAFKRSFFQKESLNNIKWEEKNTHSIGYIWEFFVLSVYGFLFFSFLVKPIDYLLENYIFDVKANMVTFYISSSLNTALFSFVIAGFISFFRKSVLVAEGSLYLDHLIFRRKKINPSEIDSIQIISFRDKITNWKLYFSFSYWLSTSFDYFFHRRSLAINLKSGKTYYLNFKNSEEIKERIEKDLGLSFEQQGELFDESFQHAA